MSKRIEFLEDYDFESDKTNYIYFKNFILNFELTNNDWYNSLIIELADRLEIVDNVLYDRYLEYLSHRRHYLFKLSILDYFINNHSFYYKIYKADDFKSIYDMKSTKYIVKNQIIVNNLFFIQQDRDAQIEELLINMEKTTDYRSHIRVINYIMNFELDNFIDIKKLRDLITITLSKKFGRAVDLKLIEFKDYLQI
ncbi:hypothetical protein IX39_12240 [Chryseobacterium formosense]|uniref:Uncharacterized protein n=1 Tax=Chryseobacterium formosense TaxID=236814 RepID=A0A085ZA76_9FLAO|nr:hypothetical protein IX39_12240 [Chryseobacterium formosense]